MYVNSKNFFIRKDKNFKLLLLDLGQNSCVDLQVTIVYNAWHTFEAALFDATSKWPDLSQH